MHTLKSSHFVVGLVAFFLVVPSFAGAQSSSPEVNTKKVAKLEAAKLKVCETKEKILQKRMDQMQARADKMVKRFGEIQQHVTDHYNEKVLPAGKTVANYTVLVQDIQTKKTAVQEALTKAQTIATSFSCSADDPKGMLTTFRTSMQDVNRALKEYRTSIKNLIVAIRTVEKPNEQPTPTPTT